MSTRRGPRSLFEPRNRGVPSLVFVDLNERAAFFRDTRRDRFHARVSSINAFVHVVLGIIYPNETKARLNSELERRSSDADFEKTMAKQFEVIRS